MTSTMFHMQFDDVFEIVDGFRVEILLFFLGIACHHLSKQRFSVAFQGKPPVDKRGAHAQGTKKYCPRSADHSKQFAEIETLSAKELHQDVIAVYEKLPEKSVFLSKGADYGVVLAALHCNRDDIASRVLRSSSCEANRTMMIKELARRGHFDKAMHLFGLLETVGALNVMACNAALDAYVESGNWNATGIVEFMRRIDSAGLVDTVTYNTLIKAYLRRDFYSQARRLVSEMRQRGLQPNTVTYNELINAAARCSNNYDHSQVWELFEEMKRDGVTPSGYTFSVLLKNFTIKSANADLVAILELIESMTEPMDEVLLSSIVEACVRGKKNGLLTHWLDKLGDDYGGVKITGSHIYGSLFKGYGFAGRMDNLWSAWKDMHSRHIRPSVITIGCMVEAIATNGDPDGAYELVSELMGDSTMRGMINSVVFGSVLKGYSRASKVDRVMAVFQEMKELNIEPTGVTYNLVIDACARNKDVETMMVLVDEMKAKGLEMSAITFNTMVKGFCQAKAMSSAFAILDKMRQARKFKPDAILYSTLLDGCCKCHLVAETETLLEDMQTAGITPTNYDLTNIVMTLGAAHRLDRAFEIVARFVRKPVSHVLSALLTACVQSRNFDRAMDLFRQADDEFSAKACQGFVRGLLRNNKHKQAVEVVQQMLRCNSGRRGASPVDDAFVAEVSAALLSSNSAEVAALASKLPQQQCATSGASAPWRNCGAVRGTAR